MIISNLLPQVGLAACIIPSLACGLEIELRYDLDTRNFFDQAGAKEAMEAAAEFYEELITDELGAINSADFQVAGSFTRTWTPTYLEPNNGNIETLITSAADLVVPADTLIIFVGGRALTSSGQGGPGGINFGPGDFSPFPWLNQLVNRGETGAARILLNGSFSSNATDFAPWGGTLFFNQNLNWNFSTTDATASTGIDFLSVALHELAHVFGIGIFLSPASSWRPLIASDGSFTGPLTAAAHGSKKLFIGAEALHWNEAGTLTNNSQTVAAFGREHGELQRPLMLPATSSTTAAFFSVPTNLELAALQDIGWELNPAPRDFNLAVELGGEGVEIGIPTTSGVNYVVNRADSLDALAPAGEVIVGDGTVQIWTDPLAVGERAFFQVEANAGGSQSRRREAPTRSTTAERATDEAASEKPLIPTLLPEQCSCHLHSPE